LIPLPFVCLLFTDLQPDGNSREKLITDTVGISVLVDNWRRVYDMSDHETIETILDTNAMRFAPDIRTPNIKEKLCNHACFFYVMPMNPVLPSFAVPFNFLTKGSTGNKSYEMIREVYAWQGKADIQVEAIATDGERRAPRAKSSHWTNTTFGFAQLLGRR
jgi:hypothetical protein